MATGTLTGQTIANTYKSLLKVTGTTAGGETLHATTLKVIEDGDGNPSPIQLAQNRLEIVPTSDHANAFEVSQADGTQIFNIDSSTPTVKISVASTMIQHSGAMGLTVGSTGAGGASISLDGDSNGDGAGGDYCYFTHDTDGKLNIVQDSPSGTNSIHFGTAGTEDKVVIDSSGRLGIGVTDPDSELEIYHASDPQIKLSIDTHGDAGIILADADGLKIFGEGASNQMRFHTDNTERMRIDSGGKIGIGDSSPQVTLDVHADTTETAAVFGQADDGSCYIATRTGEVQNNVCGYIFQVGSAALAGYGSANTLATITSQVKNDGGTLKGNLRFSTNEGDSLGGGATTMEITEEGVLELNKGQIKFPATQSASADANTLDDYEEGTWTPAWTQGFSATNYNLQHGKYVKVGGMVSVFCSIGMTASGTTTTTDPLRMELPFTAVSGMNNFIGAAVVQSAAALDTESAYIRCGTAGGADATAYFVGQADAADGQQAINGDDIGTSGLINFQITYQTT